MDMNLSKSETHRIATVAGSAAAYAQGRNLIYTVVIYI